MRISGENYDANHREYCAAKDNENFGRDIWSSSNAVTMSMHLDVMRRPARLYNPTSYTGQLT